MKTIITNSRVVLASLLLSAAALSAADLNGTWTWSAPGRNGGPERVSKLSLKVDGTKLTGNLSAPGREGAAVEIPIAEGKVEGDSVSFQVVRKTPNGDNTTHYHGKITGDKITGKIESERNGDKQSRDWEAKRWKETK